MKKIIFAGLLFISTVSCKNTETNKLLGSWRMRDVIDNTEQNFSEKTTFYKDSLIVEMFAGKKLMDKLSAKYEFDQNSNTIHYKMQKIKIDLKVLKLTDSEMELLNVKEKKPIRFVRVE